MVRQCVCQATRFMADSDKVKLKQLLDKCTVVWKEDTCKGV